MVLTCINPTATCICTPVLASLVDHQPLAVLCCALLSCLQDTNMEYTGTRYSTKVVSGYNQLSGGAAGMFVSNKLSTQTEAEPMATFSNAGGCAWCVLA